MGSLLLVDACVDYHPLASRSLALKVLLLDGIVAIVSKILHAHSDRAIARKRRSCDSRIAQHSGRARLTALVVRAHADVVLRALSETGEGVARRVVTALEKLLGALATHGVPGKLVSGALGSGALVPADLGGAKAGVVDFRCRERGRCDGPESFRIIPHVTAFVRFAGPRPACSIHR